MRGSDGKRGSSHEEFHDQCLDLSLKAGIMVSSLGFHLQGWDLGLKTGIWASRLNFRLNEGTRKGKEEEEEEEGE